ncbi:hypothetical protein [Methylicorpusculum sp.]|uniref:hypothetical protein n=1 Tax=Methylicorpusculum sp. TaxID=2713644 RepID=UPI00272B2DA9|nr:hypothetical protein [Methylicorpusculum sp.]
MSETIRQWVTIDPSEVLDDCLYWLTARPLFNSTSSYFAPYLKDQLELVES